MPKLEAADAMKMLFLPSLTGYKGLIIHIPMLHSSDPEFKDLGEALIMHIGLGCKTAIDIRNRTYDIWIPDGISTVTIQIWMHTYKYEFV
jgi:hypothetical protein